MPRTIRTNGIPLSIAESQRRHTLRREADIAAAEYQEREGSWWALEGRSNYRKLRNAFIEDYMRARGLTKTGLPVVTRDDTDETSLAEDGI